MSRSHRPRLSRPPSLRGAFRWGRALALLLVAPCPLAAQATQYGPGRGAHIQVFRGVYFPEDLEFRVGETMFQLDGSRAIFGARVGYTFPADVFLEGSFGYTPLRFSREGVLTNLNTFMFDVAVGYNFDLAPRAQVFGLAGLGMVQWLPHEVSPSVESVELLLGVGARYYVTHWLALRADFRDHVVPTTLSGLREGLNPGLEFDAEGTHNFEIGLTASFFIPIEGDRDRDRVSDRNDRCPGTPSGVMVDALGCPLDGDEDGVANFQDRCPGTPPGQPTDAEGCELDGDADGVVDSRDRCPGTGAGVPVDDAGCSRDTDADGVHDGLDRCARTGAGVPVDERGCPRDTDGDGVHDGLDRCPETPAEREVNADGCSPVEAGVDEGRLVVSSIEFPAAGAELPEEARPILDEVGRALLTRPDVRVEIRGHTDSSGSALENLRLSELRAQAVLDYLIETFPELDRERFMVRGWGEVEPVASNESEEGRAQNRRVEFIIREGER